MMRAQLAALGAMLGLAACSLPMPGSTEACALQQVAVVPLTVERARAVVDVQLDGKPVRLMVDTGAEVTFLSQDAVSRVAAETDLNNPGGTVTGSTGFTRVTFARSKVFAIGGVGLGSRGFYVSPSPLLQMADHTPVDGFLGTDFLSQFDVDFDVPDGRMVLYRGRNCPAAVPPWMGGATPLAASAAWTSSQSRPIVPMQVNGFKVDAVLDTGAELSVVSPTAAEAAGVTPEELAHDRSVGVFGATVETGVSRLHRFGEVVIGRERRRNAFMLVGAVPQFEAVIGFEYIRRHRIWISYASQRLFLGKPIPQAGAAPPAPASAPATSRGGPARPAGRLPPG